MTPGKLIDRQARIETWERIDRHVLAARYQAGGDADSDDLRDPLHEAERLILELQGRLRDLRDDDLARRP